MEKSFKYLTADQVYRSLLEFFEEVCKWQELLLGRSQKDLTEIIQKSCKKEGLSRRQSRLLLMMKIPVAAYWLAAVLGYPPDCARIATAVDEPYKRVWRFLKEKSACSTINLLATDARDIGLQKVKIKSKDSRATSFAQRMVGRRTERAKVGGPATLYAKIREPSLPLLLEERRKLEKYFSDSFYLSELRKWLLSQVKFSIIMIKKCDDRDLLNAVHSFYSSLGTRVLQIAKNERKMVERALEDQLSFDWLLNDMNRKQALQQFVKALEHFTTMSDDELKRIACSQLSADVTYPVQESGESFLVCIVCGAKIPYPGPVSLLRCGTCNNEYRREDSSQE